MNMPHRYPDEPGHRGIDTSIEVAASMMPSLGTLQHRVLSAVRAAGPAGATTNELALRMNIDRGSIQPRTSELRLRGSICDSGVRRPNANGKMAIVWIASGNIGADT